ncbi:MAG: hypothetical protein R3C02_27420 [Planctomycetaceae bacterium]
MIEVVSGLLILATLLVSILMAFNVHSRQIKSAAERLAAIELTDQLIASWYQAGELPEPGAEEFFIAQPNLKWRVSSVATDVSPIPAQVLRIEVFEIDSLREPERLATVEILASIVKEQK